MICSRDFALTQGIDRAATTLFAEQKIQAIACLSASGLWPTSARSLMELSEQVAVRPHIGVQLSLTGPFSPLSAGFTPDSGGMLPTIRVLSKAASRFQLTPEIFQAEWRAQIKRFTAHIGCQPDFILPDPAILFFGAAATGLWQALSQHKLEKCPILIPEPSVKSPKSDRPPAKQAKPEDEPDLILSEANQWQRLLWGSNVEKKLRFSRQLYKDLVQAYGADETNLSFKTQVPRSWIVCAPAIMDDRLVKLDSNPAAREQQFNWLRQQSPRD